MCGFERWVGLSRTAGNDGGKISFASVTNLGPQVLTHRSRDPIHRYKYYDQSNSPWEGDVDLAPK